ncbi:hypothetical protein [Neobacillus sp. NPDC093127]|uniref:hypothetical protein n=1 Tax=Neobacillus sp. NPDC093127 TaxID=3364296 RepID=UPI0037FC27A2
MKLVNSCNYVGYNLQISPAIIDNFFYRFAKELHIDQYFAAVSNNGLNSIS